MNERTIEEVLRKNIGAKFVGVFPRDILPQPIDGAYVINTDAHYKPGQYWVAMYLKGGRGEYYDSLGLPPMYDEFMEFLPKKWTFNSKTVHNVISEYCGHHCIYYLCNRLRGQTMRKIVNTFGDDIVVNDAIVRDYVDEAV